MNNEPSRFSQIEVDSESDADRAARGEASIAAIIARRNRSVVAEEAKAATTHVVDTMVVVDVASHQTGEMLLWELSGSVDIASFSQAIVGAGLGKEWLPKVPRPETALTLACKDFMSKSVRVEAADGVDGWFLVDVERSMRLEYRVGSRFFLDAEGVVQCDGETHAHLLPQIRAAQARYVNEVNMGLWFTAAVSKLDGVSLRRAGALYFIPRQHLDTLAKIKAAVRAATQCSLSGYAALRSADLISDMIKGLATEVANLEKKIADDMAKEVGARAARSRLDDCSSLTSKIEGYEKLLGAKFEAPRATITAIVNKLNNYSTRASQLEI